MPEHLLAIFAVWLVWTQFVIWFTTPTWFPPLLGVLLGIGAQLLIEPSDWWLGVGIGGAAGFLIYVSDLLLVTTDAVRNGVLVRLGRRG